MPDDSIPLGVDHHLHTDSLHNEDDQNLGSGWKNPGKNSAENDRQNVPVAKTWEVAGKTLGSGEDTTGALPARDGFNSALAPNKSVARMRLRKAFHDHFLRRSVPV